MKIRSFKHLIAVTLMVFSWGVGVAAQPTTQYQVEVLIYSQLSPETISQEYWSPAFPTASEQSDNSNYLAPEIDSPLTAYPTLTRLPKSALVLTTIAKRLQLGLDAQILYHSGFRIERSLVSQAPLTISMRNTSTDQQPDEMLAGTLTLSLNRYFNTRFDFTVGEASNRVASYLHEKETPCQHSEWCYFRVKAKRRTRSGVLNYVDHPIYGILFKITPVKSNTNPKIAKRNHPILAAR